MQQETGIQTQGEIVFAEPRTNANDFDMYGSITDPTTGTSYPAEFSTQDANNLELSLLYLQDSPLASSWIDQAAATGVGVTFDHTIENGLAYDGDGGLGVTWNPDIGFQLESGEIISPAGILISEFGHTVEPGGLDPNPTPDAVWNNSAEAAAHGPSNEIYADLGEPNRPGYDDSGNMVDVPSVTTHTDTGAYGDTFDLSAYDSPGFDANGFAADYGVPSLGYDGGFDSFGSYDSFGSGSYDNFGFDAGSFAADYGIGSFGFDSFGGGGGGGGGMGFSDMLETVQAV